MIEPTKCFANLPTGLRKELIEAYQEIVQNFVERRWEPAELNGGKLCEIIYTIIDGATSGSFAAKASKPAKMVDACKAIEGRAADPNRVGDRSLRIQIPRLLPFLYEIRNNRGVGHVGGDVNPNQEDATSILSNANWLMAELVRIFHNITLAEAQVAVDALVQRRHPMVWSTGDLKRVLDSEMSASDQTLVLLYSEPAWVEVKTLTVWVEYSSAAMFRNRVLLPIHKKRLIEFDVKNDRVKTSPSGIAETEARLLAQFS